MEVPRYSESTEAGVKKTLSVRREGDWTCPKCNALVFATRSECYRCHLTKPTSDFQVQIHATSHDYEKELPKIQEELTRVRKHEKKAQILREQLETQLQEQFQAHIASMTLKGVTGPSSNTTSHSTTSKFLHGAGCLRQGAAATSNQQSATATAKFIAVSSQQLNL
jgi:hypothetical protein